MVAQTISVEIDDERVRKLAKALVDDLTNPRAAFDQIGRYLASATRARFEREEGPDGKPWQASIRALAEGGQTLTDHSTLRRSITHRVAGDGRSVDVGSNLVYAAIHQFGGQAGRNRSVTLPARPFLGIDERDRNAIARIGLNALLGANP